MNRRRGSGLLAAAAIVLAGLAAYAPSLTAPFVFDDDGSIVHNPTIRHLWSWPGPLAPPHGGGVTVEGRPVLNLSLAINHAIGGLQVQGYHAVNLAIHLLAALTLLGLLRRTLPKVVGSGPSEPLAVAVALLWTLHPLQTESVTYVVQRAESLMGLFFLVTVYGFIRFAEGQTASGATARGRAWGGVSVLSCLLGMGTKEVMAVAPVVVLLCDRTFFSGSFVGAWRQRARYYLALGATWLPLAWLVAGEGGRGGTVGSGSGVGVWQYALTQPGALVHYLWLSIFPHPLIFDYGTRWVTEIGEIAVPGGIVFGLLAVTGFALSRDAEGPEIGPKIGWRALGFCGAWFFLILAPTSSLIPGNRQTLAEHRMYLPLAAVLVVLVCGAHRWVSRAISRNHRGGPAGSAPDPDRAATKLLFVPLFAAAAACGVLTASRNATYRSTLSLYADTVARRPDNPYAHSNYGFALGEAGRSQEAVQEFRRALEIKPDLADAHYNLGLVFERGGRDDDALEEYGEALRVAPRNSEARYNMALLLAREGRLAEAAGHFAELVRQKPGFADAHLGLGNALLQLGRSDEAVNQFEAAVRASPDYAEARYNLGLGLVQTGRASEGLLQIEEAIRLRPGFWESHYRFGTLLAHLGMMDRALAELSAAVQLNPGSAEAQLDLGNVQLALGRVSPAIACYEAALRLRPDYAQARHNLDYARGLPRP